MTILLRSTATRHEAEFRPRLFSSTNNILIAIDSHFELGKYSDFQRIP
jgi:hypothetical protein